MQEWGKEVVTELSAGAQMCVSSLCWTMGQETGVETIERRRVARIGLQTNWAGSLRKAALWEGLRQKFERKKEFTSGGVARTGREG